MKMMERWEGGEDVMGMLVDVVGGVTNFDCLIKTKGGGV